MTDSEGAIGAKPVQNALATLRALDFCIERAATDEGITLAEVTGRLGPASFCFVSLLLAAPFLQPMSLGPFTMASGGAFLAIGWQMTQGQTELALPRKISAWSLRGKVWVAVLKLCRRLLVLFSRMTCPRFESPVSGPRGMRNIGWLIVVGGGLLAMPCANLPFNNTLPALMIFCAAIAWLERDGLFAVFAVFWGVLTLAYFAATLWVITWAGSNILSWWRI